MSDNENKKPPVEGIDPFLMADDPQAAAAMQGFQQIAEIPQVQQALNFSDNLKAHDDLVKAALAGDKAAQMALAEQQTNLAMGSLGAISQGEGIIAGAEKVAGREAGQALGYIDKAADAAKLADAAAVEGTQAQMAAATSRKSAELDKLARLEMQKKAMRNKQRFAEGGMVENPMAPPPGLDEFLASPDSPPTMPSPGMAAIPAPDAPSMGSAPAGLDEFLEPEMREEKYGSGLQQAITGLEGAASAATFGASTAIETAAGVNPEDIMARRETNPGTHMLGQATGLVGSSFIPGVGAANVLDQAGAKAVEKLGLTAAENLLPKVGSAAAKGLVENALFQAGDEFSRMLAKDPNQTAESAVIDIGLAGILGGGISGGIGAVNPLWKATLGKKTEGLLKAVTNRLGGVEGGIIDDTVQAALNKTGLDETIAPEIRASLSNDPSLRELSSVLNQTDTNMSGKNYQKAAQEFRANASQVQAEALGVDPALVPSKGAIDKYGTGRAVGETLSKEMDDVIEPLSRGYNEIKAKFEGVDLDPSITQKAALLAKKEDDAFGHLMKAQKDLKKAIQADSPEKAILARENLMLAEENLKVLQKAAKTPGTVDTLIDKIGQLAEKEGWTASPSSEIMTEVNRAIKELPAIRNLKQLSQYITTLGDNTASKLPFGQQTPVSRAGMLMKNILRDAEGEFLGRTIGSEAGVDALTAYQTLRQNYAAAAQLKDQVAATLGLKASTSGYAKALKNMAASDGEAIINKLSGNKDAAWLELMQSRFPETAKLVKQYHLDQLAASANVNGELNSAKLVRALENMSPQLRQFAVGAEADGKIKAAHSLLQQLNDKNHNFSNTARTVDKLLGDIPSSMVGLLTGVHSHSVGLGMITSYLTKTLGKDVPDAARLALLKFLGSGSKVDGGAFKAMTDYIHAASAGQKALVSASKNVFKAGREVLPQTFKPTENDRKKLDKQLKSLKDDPAPLLQTGNQTSHYMPDHGQAMSTTSMNAVNYLNSLRPLPKRPNPLDREIPPSPGQEAAFNRALDIAQQPLVVMEHIKNGTILPQDIITLKTIYPALYSSISKNLMENLTNAVHKDEVIPYKTKVGLSMFLMQPMDSTMTPQSIQNIQGTFALPGNRPGDASQTPATAPQGAKHSMAALNKLPGMYQTPGQARAAKAIKD